MTPEQEKKAKQVIAHLNALKDGRSSWETEVSTAMELVIPNRAVMDVSTSEKSYTPSTNRHDSTASESLNLFANGMLSSVCSQSSKWFRTQLEDVRLQKMPGVGQWLDSVDEVIGNLFTQSGFYSSAWQVFLDGGGSGLGVMYIGENLAKQKIDFVAQEPKGIYIATNAVGEVDTLFIREILTTRDIIKEYGEDMLSERFMGMYKEKPFARHEIVKAVFPRDDADLYKIDNVNKPFASMHVLVSSGGELLRESGYDSFPYSVWRYEYASGDTYPLSPTLNNFPTIRRLNTISKSTTKIAELASDPPMWVPAEIYNDFKLQPRYKIKGYDPSRLPQSLNVGGNYQIGLDREQHYEKMVQDAYFADVFMALTRATINKVNMTATQVLQIEGEKASVISAIVARLTQEFFNPTFDRAFMICARNGWIDPPPEALIANGGQVSIDYLGPLAMASKKAVEVAGPVQALQNFLPLLEAYPEMRHIVKPYEVGRQLLVSGGMSYGNTLEKREFDKLLAQQQQAQAEAQQAEIQKQQAEAMNKGSKAPEPGSPAEAVMEQAQNG